MNRLPSFVRQHLIGLRALLVFTVICGIVYPLVMFGIGQVFFSHQANGSLVSYHGRVVGSSLLCQEFTDAKGNPLPQYFQPRPSFAIVDWELETVHGKYVVEGTGPNNYGCNPLLLLGVEPWHEQPGPGPVHQAAAGADRRVRPRAGLEDPARRRHRVRIRAWTRTSPRPTPRSRWTGWRPPGTSARRRSRPW